MLETLILTTVISFPRLMLEGVNIMMNAAMMDIAINVKKIPFLPKFAIPAPLPRKDQTFLQFLYLKFHGLIFLKE